MRKAKLMGLVSATVIALTSLPFAAFTASAASVGEKLSVGNGRNRFKDNCDGYSYEIWLDTTGGSGSMTLGKGATFKAEWNCSVNAGNFLARRGLDFGSSKKASDYEYIGMDYKATYQQTGSFNGGGNSRLCVYGWFENKGAAGNPPLVEYYIIEDWKDWCPSSSNSKTVTIDGAQYKIFQLDHTGPDIHGGNSTFKQYFSVRQSKRSSGHITVSDHFKAWAQQGWGIGNLYEVALNAEGWQSSGVADVTELDVYTDPSKKGQIDPGTSDPGTSDPGTSTPAESDGKFFSNDFDSSKGDWGPRGSATVSLDTNNYAEGKGSLAVTSRSQDWNGAGLSLSTSTYIPGQSYSFNGAVMQNSESSTKFKLSLEYEDASGTKNYDEIGSVTASKGEWAKIGSTNYTIPSGASNLLLYIETEGSTPDFYFDSVSSAKGGTAAKIDLSGAKVSGGGSSSSDPGTTTPTTPGTSTSSGSYPYTPGGTNFRDVFGPYFRIGTCLTAGHLGGLSSYLSKHYNSITLENEMKPQNILDQNACRQTGSVQVNLNQAANVLKFCEQNGIGVRGHTFVWYSQTPTWFFREGFNDNGAFVSKAEMDKRLEAMIKQTFDLIKKNYPKLDLYAYDVCNELFLNDGGGLRKKEHYQRPGDSYGSGGSDWAKVYGEDNNEFIIKAFKYARQYAPAGCKLYLNDYNEYMPDKLDDICNMAKAILAEGPYIDGIGMQSHLSDKYPDADTYENAIKKFSALGLDVQVTELDITKDLGDSQWNKAYEDIFTVIMKNADKISSLTLWGVSDDKSWRGSQSPLLWTGSGTPNPKPIYSTVCGLTSKIPAPNPGEVGGTTTTTTITTTTVTTTTTTAPVTTTTTVPVTTTKAPDVVAPGDVKATLIGDVNESGKVDVSDAVMLARLVAEDSSVRITSVGKLNADTNKNGTPDKDDVILILKYVAKIITSF